MGRQFWLEVIILVVVSLVLGSRGSSTDSATKLLDNLVEKIADALAKNDKCKSIKSKSLSGCTISEDCLHLTCSMKIVRKDISLRVKLNRCAEPVTVTIDVKVESENLEWSHVFTSGVEVPVPRLTYNLGFIGKAGLYVKVELTDKDGKLTLQALFAGGITKTPLFVFL
ncbi:uncharacterized protein [Acropora muricata]|uniref:uncharacterized protein isoform X2 n=1 Tax=Acropora muricata TaxID=159855 RepID=UPI0034E41C0F